MWVYGSVGASSIRPTRGPHPISAPSGPTPSRKRKVRDDDGDNQNAGANFPAPSLLMAPCPTHVRPPPAPGKQHPNPHPAPVTGAAKQLPSSPAPTPATPSGNRLLMAGYLAQEFLSRGTLFGRPYGTTITTTREEEMQLKRKQQYEGFARILWGGGVHVPGIINPTLLGSWLQKLQEW